MLYIAPGADGLNVEPGVLPAVAARGHVHAGVGRHRRVRHADRAAQGAGQVPQRGRAGGKVRHAHRGLHGE